MMRIQLCVFGVMSVACASSGSTQDVPTTFVPVAPEPQPVVPQAPSRPAGAALRVVPVDGVVSLAVGEEHACVVRADGKVLCWGNGATYRLGQGLIEASKRPVEVQGVDRALRVAAGGAMSCAIRQDASVMCWGGYRQRPGDEDGIEWPLVKRPETVAWPVSWTRQVAVGWVQASLVDGAGSVSILDAYLGPVSLPAFAPAVGLASLRDGFCALTREGGVQCVTSSESGAMGNGGGDGGYGEDPSVVVAPVTWSEALKAELVDAEGNANGSPCAAWEDHSPASFCKDALMGATAIDAHDDLACAVLADGELACWGCADCWEEHAPPLGFPSGIVASVPIRIPGVKDVTRVAVGGRHLCTLHKDGAVRCWGDDDQGQLGLGASAAGAAPTLVPGLGEVVHIDAGEATTCALRKDGTVVCWGHELGTALPERDADPADEEPAGPRITERPAPEEVGPPGLVVCRDVDVFDAGGELGETVYGYDESGRRVAEQRSRWSPSGLARERDVAFELDRAGRVQREHVTETRDDGERHVSTVDYRRDKAGRVTWRKARDSVDDEAYRFTWDARGRLVKKVGRWGPPVVMTWSEHPGAPGSPFEGLVVNESHSDSERRYDSDLGPTRFALDTSGREVYRREYDEGSVLDTWTTWDAGGRIATRRQTTFVEPFFEDPVDTSETRFTHDAAGRKVATEVVGFEGAREVPRTRTRHLYTGCIVSAGAPRRAPRGLAR